MSIKEGAQRQRIILDSNYLVQLRSTYPVEPLGIYNHITAQVDAYVLVYGGYVFKYDPGNDVWIQQLYPYEVYQLMINPRTKAAILFNHKKQNLGNGIVPDPDAVYPYDPGRAVANNFLITVKNYRQKK